MNEVLCKDVIIDYHIMISGYFDKWEVLRSPALANCYQGIVVKT